jgi:acetolactate synthase-1/2/3 large subunit
MTAQSLLRTGADVLVRRLKERGVRHVFGYPGGPLTPLYDAIYREPTIRHILARDERSAGFMADGYARATGKPGVCLAVCGPGVFNAATAIAGAFSDSVPVLLISGQVSTWAKGGPRSGYYHENDELGAYTHFTKFQVCPGDVQEIIPAADRAWAALTEGRPGPALIDAPVNVMAAQAPATTWPPIPAGAPPLEPKAADIEALARLLHGWKRPLLMVGGGVVAAGADELLVQLAERLGAPVFHTFMGKGAVPSEHPLCAGTPWKESTSDASDMASRISPLFAQADGLLAIGCRFTQVITGSWALRPPAALAQIDIDPVELGRQYPVTLGIHADARAALEALLEFAPPESRMPWAPQAPLHEPFRLGGMDLLGPFCRVVPPDAIVVADVTLLGYALLVHYPARKSRTVLHPAGAISMGYGLPAALGARAAFPDRPIVAVVGDGCFQMTGLELGTMVQEKLPVVLVLVNDSTLSLIKAIQARRFSGRFLGVDLRNPDFGMFAKAYGIRAWQVKTADAFEAALREALASAAPALVEVQINYGPA